jgi:hypothetical protein
MRGTCREAREYTPDMPFRHASRTKFHLTPGQHDMYDEIDFKEMKIASSTTTTIRT